MRITTGPAVAAIALFLAACGPEPGAGPEPAQPGGMEPAPAEASETVGAPEKAGPAPAPQTNPPVPASTSTTTTTPAQTQTGAATAAAREIEVPDFDDLDALMSDVDDAMAGIVLTETEGDLP